MTSSSIRRAASLCAAAVPGASTFSNCSNEEPRTDQSFAILPLKCAAQRSARVRIILVRHAESENNAILSRILQRFRKGEVLESLDGNELPRSRDSLKQVIAEQNIPDCSLTDRGFEQAQTLHKFVQSELFKQHYAVPGSSMAFYTSPMRRALLTAKPIAQGLGLMPQCLPSVFEIHGDAEMKYGSICLTAAHIRDEFGFSTDLLPSEGGWYIGGKEDQPAFERRICTVCRMLAERASQAVEKGRDETIIIVTHVAAIRQLLLQIMLDGQNPMAPAGAEGQFLGIFCVPAAVNTGMTVLEYRCNVGETSLKLGLCMLNSAEHLADRLDLRSSL